MKKLACTLLALAACSPDGSGIALRRLDQPIDIAFGCIAENPLATADDRFVAVPTSVCGPGVLPADLPLVQNGDGGMVQLVDPVATGFVLEGARGQLVLARNLGSLEDADQLNPGFNGTLVGRLPTAIESTADGCWVVTANSGSCDLTTVDVLNAHLRRAGAVSARDVKVAGVPMRARPSGMVAPVPLPVATEPACTDTPSGQVYVAYPSCHLVARVDLASGEILDGISFPPGGAPVLVAPGSISCPDECTTGAKPALDGGFDADGAEPIALAMDPRGTRLYVGAWDSPVLGIVELALDGTPTGVSTLHLEGARGLRRLAASGPIALGQNGAFGAHAYVYAVAGDGTVHVADVTEIPEECDTQIDRRYLHELGDVAILPCIPIGTFPRRPGVRGPGIHLPGDALPLDVAFFFRGSELSDTEPAPTPAPNSLRGTFAYITANASLQSGGRGVVFVVNVDDENHEDNEDGNRTQGPDIELAMPHVLRDSVENRRQASSGCIRSTLSGAQGAVRIATDPERTAGQRVNFDSAAGDALAPMLALVQCPGTTQANFQLASTAPPEVRAVAFPDLGQVPFSNTYTVTWEGPLTGDQSVSRRGGAVVTVGGGSMQVSDPGGQLCDLGAEINDIVQLVGCRTDSDCNPGDTCYAHPEAPVGVDGMCLSIDDVTDLAGLCRDFLISARRYTAVEVAEDRLTIIPRPEILDFTPVEGCSDAAECATIEDTELTRREGQAGLAAGSLARHTWTCDVAPTIGPEARCLMTCDEEADCSAGSICNAGRCEQGPLPAPQCLAAFQRYEVRASEAYTIFGSQTDYRHRRIRDAATGLCVDDLTASPLFAGRFGRNEPVCAAGDPLSVLEPNPCTVPGATQPIVSSGVVQGTRPSHVVRLRLPELTLDIADVTVPLPAVPGKSYSPVPDSYFFRFQTTAGHLPQLRALSAALPVRIRRAPTGDLIVLDSADLAENSTRGQMIKITISDGITLQTLN